MTRDKRARVDGWSVVDLTAAPDRLVGWLADVTVPPPPFDALAEAELEAESYGWHNPEANDRVAALRARDIRPDAERLARSEDWDR